MHRVEWKRIDHEVPGLIDNSAAVSRIVKKYPRIQVTPDGDQQMKHCRRLHTTNRSH